ncbi:adhesion G-protein coupled receptor G5 [Eublepharis macularius]|uniref:Adhesion G-protein coupled receptor G5 n=1 Tax=Eublepharis macularius TaxID=481883 RepID=A0AA97KH36_EUBMA|nr:adhesion G-protein coupled receptor G5 [Eublepharis macularius]
MDPGLWICLFACTAFLVELAGVTPSKEVIQNAASGAQEDLGKYEVEEAMRTFKRHLAQDCVSERKERMRAKQNLEKTLLEANMSRENLTVAHQEVQTLIFRIKPKDFRGLNVTSNMLKVNASRKTQTQHAMHFPAALTERFRALPATEMRLTCIYLKTSCLFQDEKNSSLLNDDILGATLGGANITNLSQPVEIRFWHSLSLANHSSMTCVFWMEGRAEGSFGTWSPVGCKTVIQTGIVLCQCYHLTYFAVLLEISPVTLDEGLLVPLTYITSIGCTMSAAACLLTTCLYVCSRKKQHNSTTKIHINLLEALFCLNTSFLVSRLLAPVTSEWPCQVAALFLHYSLLCCLTWMALEGFHLYMLTIRVYNLYIRCYLLKLCAVGWGLPGLAVMTILMINKEAYSIYSVKTSSAYSNSTMCWITSLEVHYFNLIYLSGTVLFNMSILTLVVQQLRRLKAHPHQQKENPCRNVVAVLGLTCLLGATWTLPFVSFGVFSIPQIFLFTVLNSLQGLFICLWYCALRCHSQESLSGGTCHPSWCIAQKRQDSNLESKV